MQVIGPLNCLLGDIKFMLHPVHYMTESMFTGVRATMSCSYTGADNVDSGVV